MRNEKKSVHIWIGEENSKFTVDIQGDIHPANLYTILEHIKDGIFEEYKDEIYNYVQEQERQNIQS